MMVRGRLAIAMKRSDKRWTITFWERPLVGVCQTPVKKVRLSRGPLPEGDFSYPGHRPTNGEDGMDYKTALLDLLAALEMSDLTGTEVAADAISLLAGGCLEPVPDEIRRLAGVLAQAAGLIAPAVEDAALPDVWAASGPD